MIEYHWMCVFMVYAYEYKKMMMKQMKRWRT